MFAEFDVPTKLRVLVQLSQWTLINAERMRERMPETKDTEQIQWVRVVGKLRPVFADGSRDSVSKRSDTTKKSDFTSCSMTIACIVEQIPDYLPPLHPSPKQTPKKAKLLHELVNEEKLQKWKSRQMTQMQTMSQTTLRRNRLSMRDSVIASGSALQLRSWSTKSSWSR